MKENKTLREGCLKVERADGLNYIHSKKWVQRIVPVARGGSAELRTICAPQLQYCF